MAYMELLERAIETFATLPMIGPKTAQKLVFWLLADKSRIKTLIDILEELREKVEPCKVCYSLTTKDKQPCDICMDNSREPILCLVAHPSDVLVFERAGVFRGYYHVLGGVISPLEGVGPETLRINELISRLSTGKYRELLIALPPTVEGDTTAFYILQLLKEKGIDIKVTRLAHGLPVGATIDYADTLTLAKALENRQPLDNA